jgi:hypothetical protein
MLNEPVKVVEFWRVWRMRGPDLIDLGGEWDVLRGSTSRLA